MKKYVCYEGNGHIWYNIEAEILEDTGSHLKYEGMFHDGVYGISFARHSNVFNSKEEANGFCNSKNSIK
jgi:hypothetical protein